MAARLAVTIAAFHLRGMIGARIPAIFLLSCVTLHAFASGELPQEIDVPPEKPRETGPADAEPAVPGTPPAGTLPEEEAACRQRLRALGVRFAEHPAISEPKGCTAAHPLTVSELPGGVELYPDAVLTCAMAEATARFVRDHAAPLVRRGFGTELAGIAQSSSYVCRPRNRTSKLSEHAFANALDWASLELEDGTVIEVRAFTSAEPRRARLMKELREAACGPFKTVLGPGSDADHADHFHFDLAERRGGATYCR